MRVCILIGLFLTIFTGCRSDFLQSDDEPTTNRAKVFVSRQWAATKTLDIDQQLDLGAAINRGYASGNERMLADLISSRISSQLKDRQLQTDAVAEQLVAFQRQLQTFHFPMVMLSDDRLSGIKLRNQDFLQTLSHLQAGFDTGPFSKRDPNVNSIRLVGIASAVDKEIAIDDEIRLSSLLALRAKLWFEEQSIETRHSLLASDAVVVTRIGQGKIQHLILPTSNWKVINDNPRTADMPIDTASGPTTAPLPTLFPAGFTKAYETKLQDGDIVQFVNLSTYLALQRIN